MATPSTFAFNAMGSTCDLTVVGGDIPSLFALAQRRASALEQLWSRFLPDSELSRLNSRPGETVAVSADTYLLIDHAVAAWKWTAGRFDPTVLNVMIDNGYDRSFEQMKANPSIIKPKTAASKAPGCAHIVLDEANQTVTLPMGVGLDPGGIGKGLAADLIVETLLDHGAAGALVSMGGDLKVCGEAPDQGWRIGIGNPFIEDDLVAVVELENHGLATSNRLMRRWNSGEQEFNHLIDPRTGRTVDGLVATTMISGQAWWSEVLAKVAMVDLRATRTMIPLLGAEGMYISKDAEVEVSPGFARFDANRSMAV